MAFIRSLRCGFSMLNKSHASILKRDGSLHDVAIKRSLSIFVCTNHLQNLLTTNTVHHHCVRNAGNKSFFKKATATQLWESCTSVSNAGKRRGRGKRARRKMNLDMGQKIGMGPVTGKINMKWPGLNSPLFGGTNLKIQIEKQVADENYKSNLLEVRQNQLTRSRLKRKKITALERGWSGRKLGGTSIGEPDSIGDYTFDGFDTRVLVFKLQQYMSGTLGRQVKYRAFVVTGNKQGLAGYDVAFATTAAGALKRAKNRAAQRLQYIPRDEGSIIHDFYAEEGATKIFVKRMPKGFGIRAHRCIKTICQTIGLDDLHVKIDGRGKNYPGITKAFFNGLGKQESFQKTADKKKLNVVKYDASAGDVPIVLATPTGGAKSQIEPDEIVDWTQYHLGGRVRNEKPKPEPFFFKYDHYKHFKYQQYKRRNQLPSHIERLVHDMEPSPEERKKIQERD